MALCLASSLIVCRRFAPYDQLVRYQWWYRFGYMSSTGRCFDIGDAIRQALDEFHRRQIAFAREQKITEDKLDYLADFPLVNDFNVRCGPETAGNGALVRLAPVPLFFFRHPAQAVEYAGISGQITHGDIKVYDACRYYGALIVAAIQGYTKDDLLDNQFHSKHRDWFGDKSLDPEIIRIVGGSYKKPGGYYEGIRGKDYIIPSLEAALWAFWSTNSFVSGALAAVNLGGHTDMTAAIYGQLAGAFYGFNKLPQRWFEELYAGDFLRGLAKWILHEGGCFSKSIHSQYL
jgi:ADP-ribosyl-[dinitrogen reductase] hydrolase